MCNLNLFNFFISSVLVNALNIYKGGRKCIGAEECGLGGRYRPKHYARRFKLESYFACSHFCHQPWCFESNVFFIKLSRNT